MPNPVRELPAGYAVHRRYILTDRRLLLILNLAALIPLGAALLLMAVWQVIVGQLRAAGVAAPLALPFDPPWWLSLIGVLVVVLPLHELLHGIVMRHFGHRVRYGFKPSMGVLYALAENALFRRNEFLLVLLTPLTVITLAGMLLNLVMPESLTYTIALGVIFNAGGAVGDLWMTGVLLHYKKRVIVQDDAQGFTVYDVVDDGTLTADSPANTRAA
ncbi:MAG: DUF3267 domain-containing protein [bacterium]|nr:DUF3267 domain-containing protein [bacterium]